MSACDMCECGVKSCPYSANCEVKNALCKYCFSEGFNPMVVCLNRKREESNK